jgi:YegS/Rv2252/BmrU family lipid kinase
MKIFLIVNKFAGHPKKFKKALKIIGTVLKEYNCEFEFAYTSFPGHASELAAKASNSKFDIVVAVGGDGTVNEVAQGLIGTSTPMGIIPMGSGNGLARDLGIPMKVADSTLNLIKGRTEKIDVCKFNEQPFFCTSGIGFDAEIAEQMSKVSSRGFLRYIQLTLKESFSFKPFSVKMIIDDRLFEKQVFLVTFANARQFGNNAFIAPSANSADGLIDVVIVNPFHKILLPVFGISLFTKMLPKLSFVEYHKAKQIELISANTKVFHFDGEPGKLQTPAKIKMASENLFVIKGQS